MKLFKKSKKSVLFDADRRNFPKQFLVQVSVIDNSPNTLMHKLCAIKIYFAWWFNDDLTGVIIPSYHLVFDDIELISETSVNVQFELPQAIIL